jgi:3-methylcrotonyl-CoA carboxylase alpha subunit
MHAAGVPVVPGYYGEDQRPTTLREAADAIGYPVLIKAVAGGGGKGMRKVEAASEFVAALEAAQREAQAAFGDARVLLENYLVRSRHIEVQVFADRHGNAIHLFERDCSLQRRHQKVVEEAPAPGMSQAMREAMGEAAVRAARAVGYEGAGTVEFIADVSQGLDPARFYFMEMNTRLQVEHPVTEMITGFDLVEWQLRVAAGEPLPCAQRDVRARGHAIEVRLYAEDPEREYLPQTGELIHLRLPEESDRVRVDTGVASGDVVSVFYDPMIAKLIAFGDDRQDALRRLRRVLAQVEVAGLTTNLGLLTRVAAHPAFCEGALHTGFLAEHAPALLEVDARELREAWVLACVGHLCARNERAASDYASEDPWSPWNLTTGFLINADPSEPLELESGETRRTLVVRNHKDGYFLDLDGETHRITEARLEGARVRCMVDGASLQGTYVERGARAFVQYGARSLVLELGRTRAQRLEEAEAAGGIRAPMPGKILAVFVKAGERVEKNAPLVRLEAMKMEHTLKAHAAGVVSQLSVRVGEQVEAGSTLLVLTPVEGG